MPSCSCWECKDKYVKFDMWIDHDARPRWAESRDMRRVPRFWAESWDDADETNDADERATKVRMAQADSRTQRYLRREQRAMKYDEIERHLRRRVTDPTTVLQLEMCYKTIISRSWERFR
jgi:hypothetical protein